MNLTPPVEDVGCTDIGRKLQYSVCLGVQLSRPAFLLWELLHLVYLGGAAPGPGPYLKVDVSIGEAVGTALVQEVDVFDEQAEEGNDDLEGTSCGSAVASSPRDLTCISRRDFLGIAGWPRHWPWDARGIGYLVCPVGSDCFLPGLVRSQC